jgi:PII-like signaling protein
MTLDVTSSAPSSPDALNVAESQDCLKLTTYFGERARANGGFLADAFSDIYAHHELQTSLVLRGMEGFGVKQHLRTDRLLTLSEDLPLVSVAVDTRQRIQAALSDIDKLRFNGLVTLERARMFTGRIEPLRLRPELSEAAKLTLYIGRQERVRGRPAYRAAVELLHRRGIAGATVMLGVDGTAHGVRERETFFGRNGRVPLMVIAVGEAERIADVLPELGGMLDRPIITLERVRVCKRDGQLLAEPRHLPETDPSGLGVWQKLMVYCGEQSQHNGQPLHYALIRELRRAGAAGATTLRGVWGYHGDHQPHGDSMWQLRRRVPVVTVIVDTPDRARDWFRIVDEVTQETGLVTSEMVPASRFTRPGGTRGVAACTSLPIRGPATLALTVNSKRP